MRNENRIDTICDELKEIWHKYPDLRLGQMILNVAQEPMLYYIEDKALIEMLKDSYK